MLHSQIPALFWFKDHQSANSRRENVTCRRVVSHFIPWRPESKFYIFIGLWQAYREDIYSYADMFRLSLESLFLICKPSSENGDQCPSWNKSHHALKEKIMCRMWFKVSVANYQSKNRRSVPYACTDKWIADLKSHHLSISCCFLG